MSRGGAALRRPGTNGLRRCDAPCRRLLGGCTLRRGGEGAEHPTVLSRSEASSSLENAAEERRVVVADIVGDFLEGHGPSLKQALCLLNAKVLNIGHQRRPGCHLETALQAPLGDP